MAQPSSRAIFIQIETASVNAPLFEYAKGVMSMNNHFPNSVASSLALIFVEKNSKAGDHPEDLYNMYTEALEVIKDLEKQRIQDHYQNS